MHSSELTSWSPHHVGRAKAVAAAFDAIAYIKGDVLDTQDPLGDNVYGSDVGGHLDLLARREGK